MTETTTGARPALPPTIDGLQALAADYDVLLCDIWGVVHNGIRAHERAVEALARFRAGGGQVVLITNAPRRHLAVREQLADFGVPNASYDAIVTSGDVTRALLRERADQRFYHLGPQRDRTVFEDLDLPQGAAGEADYVLCTGLIDDDTETPQDYEELLRDFRSRRLDLICVNPDLVVERGDRLIYCAGALAARYRELGGTAHYAGKPHAPIYAAALQAAEAALGRPAPPERVLAIGDGIGTDIKGAARAGLDSLFVLGGIHAREIAEGEAGATELAEKLAGVGAEPRAMLERLVW
jgi:HAD superfamily hydrolase (TIGR01459 family)